MIVVEILCITNEENGSKNRSGLLKDKPDDNKVIKHYGNSTLGDTCTCRCYYHVLKFYFEKLSPTVLSNVSALLFIGSAKRSYHFLLQLLGLQLSLLEETLWHPLLRLCVKVLVSRVRLITV